MLTWRYFCSSNGTIIDDESEQTVVVGAVLGQCFQELVTFTGSAVIIAAYATYVLIGLRYHRSYGVEMNIEAAASEKRGICKAVPSSYILYLNFESYIAAHCKCINCYGNFL